MQSPARRHFLAYSSLVWIFWFLAAVAIPLSSVRAGGPLTAETPRMIGPGPRVYGESLPQQKSRPAATPEQFEQATPEAPPRITSIEGINFDEDAANNTDSSQAFYHFPPDPHGAAGLRHVVSVVNTSIEWFTKGGVVQHSQRLGRNATTHVGSFFEPITPMNDLFDPKVIYDQYNDRFLVVALERQDTSLGDPVNSSRILLAVSDDADPNGNWHYLAINSRIDINGAARWADYPGFAVGEQAVYVTANMFGFGGGGLGSEGAGLARVRLWIIAKGAGSGGFYDGGAPSFTVHDPIASATADRPGDSPPLPATIQPAHMYGFAPPGVGTFLVSYSGLTAEPAEPNEFVQVIRVSNALPIPTFAYQFVDAGDIDNATVDVPGAPQAGTTSTIETNDRRAINAVWRNNSLWLAAVVVPGSGADSGQTTAHWWQIDTTTLNLLRVTQQGNVGGEDIAAGAHTFYPSVAVDRSGNMGIGFAASAPTIYPGAYYTGRLSTDADGTVQPSVTLAAGLDFYFRTDDGGNNRWGDFSATTIDPSDDATFWVFNEYALMRGTVLTQFPGQDGRWGTRFGSFTFTDLSHVACGDTAILIQAITSPTVGMIDLNPQSQGDCTYTLTTASDGLGNGLPVISRQITINGNGAIIQRSDVAGTPEFRIFFVEQGGNLTLNNLTVGNGRVSGDGGGIANFGTVQLINSTVRENHASSSGGGIFVERGQVSIMNSIVAENTAENGGGVFNSDVNGNEAITIINSSINKNVARSQGGGIFVALGGPVQMRINNSTLADNSAVTAGGIFADSSRIIIINSTLANNRANQRNGMPPAGGGGVGIQNSLVQILNSTLANNNPDGIEGFGNVWVSNTIFANAGRNCSGNISVTSFDGNIATDGSCTLTEPSDHPNTNPLLGQFLDPGPPGMGRFPLRSDSPAIDAGIEDGTAGCKALEDNLGIVTDQLGQPRSVAGSVLLDRPRVCDIGAVEFFLPVNDLVQEREGERVTQFDPTPAPGAPAGTFLIIVRFDNISDTFPPSSVFANKTIFFPFFEVAAIQLSRAGAPAEDQPVLLNADRGPGRVGARLTPPGSLTITFAPGTTAPSFQFRIGLQKREPFVFFVNMLGEPRSSTSSVSMR